MAQREVGNLVFVDETGVNIAMTRRYGRAPKGKRAYGSVPKNWGKNVTVLGALRLDGVVTAMSIEGATDSEVFVEFVAKMLVPELKPGDIVIMDNLGAHKVEAVRVAIAEAQAELIYLPPYSPDLSPIEPCWSKLKTKLRADEPRTRTQLDSALTIAFETITAQDAQGWFRHCGYAA